MRQRGELRHTVERDIQFPGRAANLEMFRTVNQLGWQVGLIHYLQERAFCIQVRHDGFRSDYFA